MEAQAGAAEVWMTETSRMAARVWKARWPYSGDRLVPLKALEGTMPADQSIQGIKTEHSIHGAVY